MRPEFGKIRITRPVDAGSITANHECSKVRLVFVGLYPAIVGGDATGYAT